MNLNIDISKYIVPALGAACVGGALLVVSGLRAPVELEPVDPTDVAQVRVPENLKLDRYIPTMEEVLAKHLFVPERVATGENAFPDLVVKGVYIGESQRNAVFSLKSKPTANLRVWQGDEAAALSQVEDERDPRQPIVEFLNEWSIQSIDFAGVTVQHIITGEVETYPVEYKPLKQVKDSAGGGYGQGALVDTSPVTTKAPATSKAAAQAQPSRQNPGGFSPQAAAGRVGAFMQRMSPQQRQQFMQQLQKQNAAANKKSGSSDKKSSASRSSSKKGGSKRNR